MRRRTVFWVSVLAYAALVGWQAFALPDQVPAHLDLFGAATRWHSRTTHVWQASALGAFVLLVFVAASRLLPRLSPAFVNLPNADYWMRAENLPRLTRMAREDLALIGAATFVLLTVVMAQLGAVALGRGVPGWFSLAALAVYVVLILASAAWMYIGPRYAIPRTEPLAAHR